MGSLLLPMQQCYLKVFPGREGIVKRTLAVTTFEVGGFQAPNPRRLGGALDLLARDARRRGVGGRSLPPPACAACGDPPVGGGGGHGRGREGKPIVRIAVLSDVHANLPALCPADPTAIGRRTRPGVE